MSVIDFQQWRKDNLRHRLAFILWRKSHRHKKKSFYDETYSSLLFPYFRHSLAAHQAAKRRLPRWQLTWRVDEAATWRADEGATWRGDVAATWRGDVVCNVYADTACHVAMTWLPRVWWLLYAWRSSGWSTCPALVDSHFRRRSNFKFMTEWIITSSLNELFHH